MTFEQYRFLNTTDAWDICHPPRKVNQAIRFVKHRGRTYNVLGRLDDVMKVETLTGRYEKKVLHELDLD
jgi:hypothetical protein